jgi:hypothetical protein
MDRFGLGIAQSETKELRMRFQGRLISVLVCACVSSVVFADMVTVDRYGNYFGGLGGEDTITPIGWSWNPYPLYSSNTQVAGGLQTFCVELVEPITPGVTYDVVLNDRAIWGGVGPQGNPLSVGTAWLYHEFQKGNLQGYDYTPGIGRKHTAQELQLTIWWLEGYLDDPGDSNPFRNLALATFPDPKADNNGLYPVGVLNLYAQGHLGDPQYRRQDFPVCIPDPVPVPAALLLCLLGLGTSGLGLRRIGL